MHGNKSPHMLATKVIGKMMTNRAIGPFDTGCKDWVSHTDFVQQWFVAMMSRHRQATRGYSQYMRCPDISACHAVKVPPGLKQQWRPC